MESCGKIGWVVGIGVEVVGGGEVYRGMVGVGSMRGWRLTE